MSFSDTYEARLRSDIENRVEILKDIVEEIARNRLNTEATLLEEQLDRETDNFMVDVTKRLDQIHDEIKSYRPANNQDPDYEIRLTQYLQLVENSSTGVNKVTKWVRSLFDKILSVIKSIVQWITDNPQTIIDIIQQIRHAFQSITVFFKHH